MKIRTGVLRKTLPRLLDDGFLRLVLESREEGAWIIEPDRHPETDTPVLVASHGDRKEVHPVTERDGLILRLSRAGFVKHTYVVDERRRVVLDARYGKAKEKVLDDATLKKISGGRDDPLRPDNAGALLRELGLMTAKGTIPARGAKKLKQVNDFVRVLKPVIEKLRNRPRGTDEDPTLRFVDLACGNSYLAFVVARTLAELDRPWRGHGVDSRPELIERSRARAARLGFDALEFECARLEDWSPKPADLAISLHACDTATDLALIRAVEVGAEAILVVPCCQNELFLQLDRDPPVFPELCRQSLYRRAFAATLTDALRALALEALGYKVKVLEFTAALHTTKALMIRARKVRGPCPERRREFTEACERHAVRPMIAAIFDAAERARQRT